MCLRIVVCLLNDMEVCVGVCGCHHFMLIKFLRSIRILRVTSVLRLNPFSVKSRRAGKPLFDDVD